MLMPWRQMKGKQHCWSIIDIYYFCLVVFCVMILRWCSKMNGNCAVLQKAIQWQALHFTVYSDHFILVIEIKYTLITGKPVIHVRITAAIVKTCINPRGWLIADFCVWSQMVSLITTEVHLVFSRFWTLLKSGCMFSYLVRGDTIPRTYYYNQSKISRNWMFSGLKHNFVI